MGVHGHLDMSNKLLRAADCLAELFPEATSRPSLRSFKSWQAKGFFPFHKIGRSVFFDPEQVRAALDRRFQVNANRECQP
jgi:hypothetical protein